MAKTRSPQYPAISLKEAVDKVRQIWEQDYQNTIPRPVVAQHMGYQSLNGKSLGVLAALSKYGLLEGRGDNTKVTDLAVQILAHPTGTKERAIALAEAAAKPELFAELEGKFPGGKASDQAIRSYLLTQKFIPSAADAAIRAYRETKAFADTESLRYNDLEGTGGEEEVEQIQEVERPGPSRGASRPPVALPSTGPYRVSIVGGRLQGDFDLTSPAEADEMVRFINAWKVLLMPAGEAPRPAATWGPGDKVPVTGNYWRNHPNGHSKRERTVLQEGQTFPVCTTCGNDAYYTQVQIGESTGD